MSSLYGYLVFLIALSAQRVEASRRAHPHEYECLQQLARGAWDHATGRWVWDPPPAGPACDHHYLGADEAAALLGGKRILFVGNSVQRRTLWAAVDLLLGGNDTWHPRHDDWPDVYHPELTPAVVGVNGWNHTFRVHDESVNAHAHQQVLVDLERGDYTENKLLELCDGLEVKDLEISTYLYDRRMQQSPAAQPSAAEAPPPPDPWEACTKGWIPTLVSFEADVDLSAEPAPLWVRRLREAAEQAGAGECGEDPGGAAWGGPLPPEEPDGCGRDLPCAVAASERAQAMREVAADFCSDRGFEGVRLDESRLVPLCLRAATGQMRVAGELSFDKEKAGCEAASRALEQLQNGRGEGASVRGASAAARCRKQCRDRPIACPAMQGPWTPLPPHVVQLDFTFVPDWPRQVDLLEKWRETVGLGADVVVLGPTHFLDEEWFQRSVAAVQRAQIARPGARTPLWLWRHITDIRGVSPSAEDLEQRTRAERRFAEVVERDLIGAGIRSVPTTNATIAGVTQGALMHEAGNDHHFDDRGRMFILQMILNALRITGVPDTTR